MPKTLLLADDSVTIQKVVGISFANEDVNLVTVDNGDDAVSRAREIRPDLILADVVMPGLSGYEVCHAVKSDPDLSGIPVLLLTGTFETFDEAQANEVGADGHITKPFEAQALVDQVNTLLANRSPAGDSFSEEEPEPLGLTGLVTPGAGPEPYDLFEDDVTAPSGTADGPLIESPPTTVLIGGEPLDAASASGAGSESSGSLAGDRLESDANALTSSDFANGPDLFSDANQSQDGTVLLDPASGPGNDLDLLTDENDSVGSGDPFADSPLITAEPESSSDVGVHGPGGASDAAEAMLLDDDFSDPTASQRSASLFGVSDDAESGSIPEPAATADPLDSSDPGGATTLLAEPPPAPDAPTVFEFGNSESAAEAPSASPSSPEQPSAAPPAAEADLFADDVHAPSPPDLFSDESASVAPDLFAGGETTSASHVSDGSGAVSPDMLYDDDPMGQTTLDPEAGRGYDVSSSDLGASATTSAPAPIILPSEPNWPPDPEAATTQGAPGFDVPATDPQQERHEATPAALSPMLEQQVHDAVEKMAWDAFGDLAERIIKDAVERIEKVAWEVIPQMTETLIQEEIRKLKGKD